MKIGNAYIVICRDGPVYEAEYGGALDTKNGVVYRFAPLPFVTSTVGRPWVHQSELEDCIDLGYVANSIEFEERLRAALGAE